uniref:Uncharacterized protein n=1 Tax=Macaca fascicularis TaxID=9541 RepID=A0A7N9CB71_MACFA
MSWELSLVILNPQNYLKCLTECLINRNSSGIHTQNMQVCYIVIHVP